MRAKHTSLACRLEVCKNGDVEAPIAYPKHSLVTVTGPERLPPFGVVAYGVIPARCHAVSSNVNTPWPHLPDTRQKPAYSEHRPAQWPLTACNSPSPICDRPAHSEIAKRPPGSRLVRTCGAAGWSCSVPTPMPSR